MIIKAEDDRRIRSLIADYPDFPAKGVLFRDIQPLLADGEAFGRVIDLMRGRFTPVTPDAYVGIESRGFIFSAAMAQADRVGKVMLRKAGKIPGQVESESYALEYGTATIEVGVGIIRPGANYVVVDDVLATGGTAAAACKLVQRLGGKVAGVAFVVEITPLNGRQGPLSRYDVKSLIKY